MSAGGPTLLESSTHHSLFNSFDTAQGFTGLHQMSGSNNDNMNDGGGGGGGNSAFSDEDLIASLAGFAVEGQTERDLATIKAMLMQQSSGNSMAGPSGNLNHHHNSFTHNSYSSSSGMNNHHWPMQSPVAATTTSWSATASFPWSGNVQQQPHPNTPNLAKSIELYGSGGGNNEYYSMSGGSSGRRRDVSLERNYHFTNGGLSGSRNSSRHGTVLPHARTASGSLSSNNSAADDMPTPGSSLDMDMGDDYGDAGMEEQPTAGPSMPFTNGYSGQSRPVDEMEDIQEDRMRESMEDEQQRRQREQQQQQYSTTNARSTTSFSAQSNNQSQYNPPDSRSAHPSARAADYSPPLLGTSNGNATTNNKQSRSGTHTPVNGKTISRPHSANGNHATVTSPVQTRSRSRLQMQQQEALRFTGSSAYGNGGGTGS